MRPFRLPLRCCRWLLLTAVAGSLAVASPLVLREDPASGAIQVLRAGEPNPILTQNAGAEMRPYLHPLVAPDGKGRLTDFSADRPETGIFWAFARLNDRDYYHHSGAGYWRRVSCRAVVTAGEEVKWQTEYHLLDAAGRPIMLETQRWSMRDEGSRYLLDVEWSGQALIEVTVGEDAEGGLRVPLPGRAGTAVNSNRQRDDRADGQRAVWVDTQGKGPDGAEPAHLAIFDHPLNRGYPLPWRVDAQRGFGPRPAAGGEWKIAPGKSATFRHQLYVYVGAFNDVDVDAAWRAYTGERSDSVLWNLARSEGKNAGFLTGEEAVAKMTVAPGLEVKLFASEPAITQPMAFCWDDRGRLWVAENRDYENRRTGFSGGGDSRILILEDTDGDGKMDTRKVFLEGIPFPTAIAWGFGGLWLGAPPNLLFVPDRDGDDRADRDIEVRLTGWGIQDRHETLNSFNWGPDGWLYGCQGFATRSNVGPPADGGRIYRAGEPFPQKSAGREPQYIDGGVWRYHPLKNRFEIVAHGFSNPWGLDFDDHGQMFVTACVIPHLWHVIPGGVYHRQGGRHINPHVYDDIKTIADHRHRSAHGGARIYLADAFPREYRGRIFMANLHERALLTDILEARGSGFVGRHGDDTLLANDPQWIGFSIETGPEGAVYMLDWHDGDICGNAVNHKSTGRIYRVAPDGLRGVAGINLATKSDLELVELQQDRNDWFVRRARLLLQQRAAEGRLDRRAAGRLWEMFSAASDVGRKLRAIWALHVIGALSEDQLISLLEHAEPYIRGWAVQLLGEDHGASAAVRAKFASLARADSSPVVRRYLASALQRLAPEDRWAVADGLMQHGEDADDHNVPKLAWIGIEPLVTTDAARALRLATNGAVPLLAQFVARRATVAKEIPAIADALAAASGTAMRRALLEGLRDGLGSLGRRELSAPVNWPKAETALRDERDPAVRELLAEVGQLFGSAKAAAAQLAALQDRTTAPERRREILRAFARDGYAPALPVAIALLDNAELRRDAIRALAAFEDPGIAPEILRRYAGWSAADKTEAILALAARKSGAEPLFAALQRATIPKRDISAFAARQLQRVLGPAFVDFWGAVSQPDEDKQADIALFKRQLTDEALGRANLANGRAIFERTCSPCHTLYGQGGKVGPDITGSNRGNLDYILSEIINPSEVIPEGYQVVTITTRDGRTVLGNIAAEDDGQVTLRMIGQDTVIPKGEILARETSPLSMMPEGLLKMMTRDEVRDLIGYLRTTQQVPLAKVNE